MQNVLNAIVHSNRQLDNRELLDICGGFTPEWFDKEYDAVMAHQQMYIDAGSRDGLYNADFLEKGKPWPGIEDDTDYVHMVKFESDDLPVIDGTQIVYWIENHGVGEVASALCLFGRTDVIYRANGGFCLRYDHRHPKFIDPKPIEH